MKPNPEKVIEALQDIANLDGKCYEVHRLLRLIYPEAIAWYNENHVITRIDGKFYDKTGLVAHTPYLPEFNIDAKFDHRCDKE